MIPRIIHWGIFGGYKMNALEERCVATWSRILPDYEIRFWHDTNGPTHSEFFRSALRLAPIKASNYVRLWALYEFGGVFLDSDVEILKPLDLEQVGFVAFQHDHTPVNCVNAAVQGSVHGHPFLKDCLNQMEANPNHPDTSWYGPGLVTQELIKRGLKCDYRQQVVDGIAVYEKDVFYPWRWDESPSRDRVTDRTQAIHWWNGSWTNRHPNARDNF